MAKLKAGVIGLGMGWGHLRRLHGTTPMSRSSPIADRIEAKRRENAKKEFNLPTSSMPKAST